MEHQDSDGCDSAGLGFSTKLRSKDDDDTTGHCSILALDQAANLARLFAELCGFASESPVPIGLFAGDKFSEICALFESDNRLIHFSLARGERVFDQRLQAENMSDSAAELDRVSELR